MRLNGELIIWDHIIEVFKEERRLGWNMCGLTSECVYLDNFSKMRVNLMEKVESFHIFSIVLFIHVSHKHRSNNIICLWSQVDEVQGNLLQPIRYFDNINI